MTKHPKETDRLRKIVEAFPKITVTVLGDLVADEFVFGEISRVSREAPVLILKHRERTVVPGGGANAANNLADLGVNVLPVGIVGDDEPGRMLLKYFRHKRIAVSGVLKDKSYTTVTKTRILAGMTHTSRQQVVRVDREPQDAPNPHLTRELYLAARNYAHASDALLVSDYGYGAATPALVSALREKGQVTIAAHHSRLALSHAAVFRRYGRHSERARSRRSSRHSHRRGLGQGYRCRRTSHGAHETAIAGDHARPRRHGRLRSPHKPVDIPIFGSDQVTDVTGAGDTVIATFTAALGGGRDDRRGGALANYAGGIVVMKRGTATVSRDELLHALEQTPPATRPH